MEQLARVERLEQELGREQVGALACLINNSNICAGIVDVIVKIEVVVAVLVVEVDEELFFGHLNSGPTEGDAEPPHHFHFEQRDEGKFIALLNLSNLVICVHLCSMTKLT